MRGDEVAGPGSQYQVDATSVIYIQLRILLQRLLPKSWPSNQSLETLFSLL